MHKNLVSYETEGEIVFSDRRVNIPQTPLHRGVLCTTFIAAHPTISLQLIISNSLPFFENYQRMACTRFNDFDNMPVWFLFPFFFRTETRIRSLVVV